jgi:hypothetical protein
VKITFAQTAPGTVYRALLDDVTHPFVTIADGPGYDEIHEDGAPEGRGGVTLIEPFEVPDAAQHAFLTAWHDIRERLAGQRGYLGSRLLRGDPGYVAIARWSSPLMYARATKAVDTTTPFRSQPALYLPA